MRNWLITGMLLLLVSALPAAEWYDPGDWLDDDEESIKNDWWVSGFNGADGLSDGSYNIYGYDTGTLAEAGQGWGYGYDYNTVDWYEYDDAFTEWYEDTGGGWFFGIM